MKKRVSAYARATVVVEITGLGTWGPECTADQIHRQAAESAKGRIENCRDLHNVRLIGEPKVTAIYTEEER